MATFYITGANGFIGSRLNKYLEINHTVIPLTRGLDGTLNSFFTNADFLRLHQPKNYNDSHLVHVGAIVHKSCSSDIESIIELYNANVALTLRLAERSAAIGIKRFVFVSTIGVHGSPICNFKKPINEHSPLNPYDLYTFFKLVAENRLKDIFKETATELVIARPALVYGQNAKGNLKTLVKAVNKLVPLPVKGIYNQRSFLFVENLVNALSFLALHPEAGGQSFVIADKEVISTSLLVKMLSSHLCRPDMRININSKALQIATKIPYFGHKLAKMTGNMAVDIAKICSLGWNPPFSQEIGFKIAFNLENMSDYNNLLESRSDS